MMKRNLGNGTQALRELADSLDIVRPSGALTSIEIRNARKNRELIGRRKLLTSPMYSVDELMDLIVSSCHYAPTLFSLMGELDGTLHENDSYGSVIRTTYSGGSTTITVSMQPTKFSNLIVKLALMPYVERVEEQSYAQKHSLSRFGGPQGLNNMPARSVQIMLKDANLTRQAPRTTLN